MWRAAEAGLSVVGLTDHDTASGWDEAAAELAAVNAAGGLAGRAEPLSLVRGAEFTTRSHGISTHLVGLLFDPESPAIVEHFAKVRESRRGRAREIVDRLSEDFPIGWDDVLGQAGEGATIGRPHIADALVVLGVIPDRSEAFVEILHPRSKYYVAQYAPETADVVGWIAEAGGRSVLAHPRARVRGRVIPELAIEELAEAGLFGVEIEHRDNDESGRIELTEIVTKLGLARFGSSDYHGSGKPNRLGENCTSPDVYEAVIDGTFLEVLA